MGILLGLLFVTPLVLAYLAFIRWADRFQPEPWWRIVLAFLWGACFATLGGGTSSGLAEKITREVLHVSADGADFLGSVVFAPVFEELFKAIGVALFALLGMTRVRRIDGPLDGAIYGGVVGLGFTLTEDILYVSNRHDASGLGGFFFLWFLRTVLLGLSHCTFTACTGLGLGIAIESRHTSVKILAPALGFFAAVGMHAVHNFLPTVFADSGAVVMMILTWGIVLAYFVLLGGLVVRDRGIIVRELVVETGALLRPEELRQLTRYFGVRALSNAERKRQAQLIELAFVTRRLRREGHNARLAARNTELRQQLRAAFAPAPVSPFAQSPTPHRGLYR